MSDYLNKNGSETSEPSAESGADTIVLNNIFKTFCIYGDRARTFKERFLRGKGSIKKVEVLKDVSLNIRRGESVAFVGKNGSGKSTLLKIINKTMYPDSGNVQINGRVSSIIELGAGFHPDFTGRENIYTNASIYGLTHEEIDRRLPSIIAFSELQDYIDSPVRTYSSGMYARLAFSVAINVDADILLIDEILAVGDASFQAKCMDKLREIKASGTTIVLVSHSLGQVEQICERSIWIDRGIIRMQGPPNDVHPVYMQYMGHNPTLFDSASQPAGEAAAAETPAPPQEEKPASILSVELLNNKGEPCDSAQTGETMTLKIAYRAHPEKIEKAVIGVGIFRNDGIACYGTNTKLERLDVALGESGTILCEFHEFNLLAGRYSLDVGIYDDNLFAYDFHQKALWFNMYSTVSEAGIAKLDHEWKIG